MIRAATVTDVTPEGVWVVSSWLSGRTGPLFAVGLPAVGDAVLVVRTDDDALVVVAGGLPDGSVTSVKIADGTIVDADINASAGIARSKIDGLPVTSTDNAVARFDGTAGALQDSGATIDDNANMSMPGDLSLTHESGTGRSAAVSADASRNADLHLQTQGSARWTLRKSSDAESGSNAGSNLALVRRSDAGSQLSLPVVVWRASGRVKLGDVGASAGLELGSSGPRDMAGSGSPEGVVSAPVGSTWRRTDGGSGSTFYVKESGGSGNTGWVGK